jgi:nicotinate-nucleotide pyrophosphorylase (carboxylating)
MEKAHRAASGSSRILDKRLSGGWKMIDRDLIKRALAEDLQGGQDITSVATVSGDEKIVADFTARKSGVVAGIDMARAVLEEVGLTDIAVLVKDGASVKSGEVLMTVRGDTRAILLAERTALNFLGHLSGIATLTRTWVDAIAGTNCIIRDTRKTTPGMRLLEKYAVRMGGGANHRMSLSDAALIKDNHIAAAGGVAQAFSKVREKFPTSEIEIEVDTLDQLREVLPLKPDLVLLDNMSPAQCTEAVSIVAGATKLEASGGITLDNAKAYALTGVQFLAIGALTHSAPVFDIGLDLRAE